MSASTAMTVCVMIATPVLTLEFASTERTVPTAVSAPTRHSATTSASTVTTVFVMMAVRTLITATAHMALTAPTVVCGTPLLRQHRRRISPHHSSSDLRPVDGYPHQLQ